MTSFIQTNMDSVETMDAKNGWKTSMWYSGQSGPEWRSVRVGSKNRPIMDHSDLLTVNYLRLGALNSCRVNAPWVFSSLSVVSWLKEQCSALVVVFYGHFCFGFLKICFQALQLFRFFVVIDKINIHKIHLSMSLTPAALLWHIKPQATGGCK